VVILRGIKTNALRYETSLSDSCSDVAAVLSADAIWLFYVGTLCDDDSLRLHSVSLLSEWKNGGNVGVWGSGVIVSANV
jgi:hypothetical protein